MSLLDSEVSSKNLTSLTAYGDSSGEEENSGACKQSMLIFYN